MGAENVKDLMKETVEKIKNMVDTDTIIGKPITVDSTTIIPVSKITYGFGSGASDSKDKKDSEKTTFGGGGAAGISVVPIAFLNIKDGDVKVLQVEPYFSSVDRIIELAPDIIDKIKGLFKKDKKVDDCDENKEQNK